MAVPDYVTHVGFGHTVDELAYGSATTGWTLVSAARNYIEADDTAGVKGFSSPNTFTPKTNVWMSCSLLHHMGQIATGAEIHVLRFVASLGSNTLQVAFLQSTDNDHFVIRLTEAVVSNVIGTGSVELAVDTDFTLLIWQDGTKVRLKVNATEDDIDVSHTGKVNKTQIQGLPSGVDGIGSGDKVRIGPVAVHHSNAAADRPGVNIGDQVVYPDGNKLQEYGAVGGNCDPGDTSGTYTDVDDWASGTADDATTAICENASEGGRFLATMTTVTVLNNFTGCRFVIRNRANVGSKTINWKYLIRDNDGTPNEIAITGQNLGSTSFATRSMEFPDAPDGGAWSQGELDNLNCGVRSNAANGANDEHTVFMLEPCTIDLNPPPAAGGVDRRRLLAA